MGKKRAESSSLSRDTVVSRGVNWLERPTGGKVGLSIEVMRWIADAYQIHWLMLDPLVATYGDEICVVSDTDLKISSDLHPASIVEVSRHDLATLLKRFRLATGQTPDTVTQRLTAPPQRGAGREYGVDATYRCPKKRIGGTESVLVHLRLEVGGASDWHRHRGDEIMFVRSGRVRVELKDMGLPLLLGKHDLVHFYAEQKHGVVNIGDTPAEILVIRLWSPPRYKFNDELKNRSTKTGTIHLRTEIQRNLVPFRLRREKSAAEIVDRRALAWLLNRAHDNDYHHGTTLADIARNIGCSTETLNRIRRGEAPVDRDQIEALAREFSLALPLLYEFTRPAWRPVVVVSNEDGWEEVPGHAQYKMPCSRLADSNLSFARLLVNSKQDGPRSRHPGCEIIIPLKGQVEIRHDSTTDKHFVGVDSHLYAHYVSSASHSLHSKDDAEVLLLRLYE